MKNRFSLPVGTSIAAILIATSMGVSNGAEPGPNPTNPGLVPGTGQINPGFEPHPWSQSNQAENIPTPDEARSALMTPVSRQPSTGDASAATTGTSTQGTPGAPGSADAASEPPPSGPIGSFGQTIPAKFSKRNDLLDHIPTMALPLPLSDEQRKQIYDAVMADKSQPVAGADELKPSSELSPDQALGGMHPLPESVRSIDGVSRLYYVKAKGKVFLVEPATRTVVGQITS